MPKCHKKYPNCIWQVSAEWHTLSFYSTLLTKVCWKHATPIERVCITPISPKTSKLDLTGLPPNHKVVSPLLQLDKKHKLLDALVRFNMYETNAASDTGAVLPKITNAPLNALIQEMPPSDFKDYETKKC